jgi:hypothetical protein
MRLVGQRDQERPRRLRRKLGEVSLFALAPRRLRLGPGIGAIGDDPGDVTTIPPLDLA